MERLTGRLQWERIPDGIRVEIPLRFNWAFAPGLISAFFLPVYVDGIVRKSPIHGKGWTLTELFTVGLLLVAILVVPALTSRRIVILTANHLRFGTEGIGRKLGNRTYFNSWLHDLRSNPVVSEWTGKDIRNRNTVEISDGKAYHGLASGLTDTEAAALIDKLMGVFAFPKDLQVNQLR